VLVQQTELLNQELDMHGRDPTACPSVNTQDRETIWLLHTWITVGALGQTFGLRDQHENGVRITPCA
jgi:hypothetical protein